jgi:soluble lytic murein transglycosylase-like protein
MPNHPTQLRLRPLGQRLGERVLVGGRVHAHLDQLVIAQRGVDCDDHGIRDAGVAHLNQGVQGMGLGAQVAALETGELGTLHFAHGAHSTGARALGRAHVALLCLVLWLGVACATTAPQARASFAPTPREALLPTAHPPMALDEVADTEPASLLDQAPPESASLLYTRAVLERKGAKLDPMQREGVARALVRAEAEHGLSVLMTLALIEQESRFHPHAKGPTGSLGLMQVQPVTAREVARLHGLAWQSDRTLFDPVQNVRIGLAYLAELRARFGSTDHAMAAYNIGPGALNKLLEKRPLRHGPYLKKVHAHAETLRAQFGHPETAIGG